MVPPNLIPPQLSCIPVEEAQRLQQEATCTGHASFVAAPVFQSVGSETGEHVETLAARNVPSSLFLDLGENPRLDEGAPGGGLLLKMNYLAGCGVNKMFHLYPPRYHTSHIPLNP